MIWLNFELWSGGAHNFGKWGIMFKRIYIRGRWTPMVIYWPHLLLKQA